ncbi:preprotein translocase subunit SecG [Oryzifoliimicrobium ureilyticus]|uniref:preprotein translocase subunit SecG n=1 Tax=Oryzifoliimicrobium ureilyticus TaxID=3113724 RepID=UPI0030761CEF
MQTILIVIHLMIVLALVGVVLIQRSEGGGLGIGGGSGFMSARGTANALTRTTAILATLFFLTSLGLGILNRYQNNTSDILNRIPATSGQGNGILDSLSPSNGQAPAAPAQTNGNGVPTEGSQAPAPSAPSSAAPAPTSPAAPAAPATAPASPAPSTAAPTTPSPSTTTPAAPSQPAPGTVPNGQ